MSILGNIIATLNGTTTLTKGYCGDNIYQGQRAVINSANGGLPCVVLNIVSSVPSNTMTGRSTIDRVRVQFDCYGATNEDAATLATYVREDLDYTGTDGSPFSSIAGGIIAWGSCVYDNEHNNPFILDSGNNGAYCKSIDMLFRISQL